MRVRFWGTRGSIAKPGPSTLRYGGNTPCVEVRSAAGTLVVLDCGTGAHGLGQALMATGRWQPLRGHILISHTHWDHIQGLPFFAPLFVPGNEWDIHAPRGLARSLRDTLAGQMEYAYFPITLEQLGATVRYHDLVEGTFTVGDIRVRTWYLNHPALTLGYRLEADGVAVVYASDHEPFSRRPVSDPQELGEQDRRHAEFLRGADLVIHDAPYTADEYAAKAGWGHSTLDYAVAVSLAAGARRLAFIHHDPLRDDDALDHVVACVQARLGETAPSLQVFAAAEGQSVELEAAPAEGPARVPGEPSAVTPVPPAFLEHAVLVGSADPTTAAAISKALRGDGVRVIVARDSDAVRRHCQAEKPSLVILERDQLGADTLEVCRALRGAADVEAEVPVIVIAPEEDGAAGAAAGVTDWLVKPFSDAYARTRVRAWLLRIACRWMRAPVPEDEERRLAALHQLGILDTEPEERFDRLTRLAGALFDVPIALVSLVDRDRQWFKSSFGLGVRETPRELSFCAHAVLSRETLVVPDALLDPRFGDNPQVVEEPRIRFYAGQPLVLPDGSCAGTLCLVDTRPRELDQGQIALLRDLGVLAQRELAAALRS